MQSDIDSLKNELKRINDKLTQISSTLDSQQRHFETVFEIQDTSIEAMSIIRYYASMAEDITSGELKEGVMSCLERLEEIRCSTLEANLQEMVQEKQQFIFGALLDLTKRKKILPGEVFSLLNEMLGPEGTMATVDVREVARVFGTAEASNWKKLVDILEVESAEDMEST